MLRRTGIINSQKLVSTSGHIDVEMFPFKEFLVYKLKYCVVHRSLLQENEHYLKQGLTKRSRATFGDRTRFDVKITGQKGGFFDPFANEQDGALYLLYKLTEEL